MRLAFPALVVGNLCLAFGPWLVRIADVGPVSSSFWRLAFAVPFLWLICRLSGQKMAGIGRRHGKIILIGGLFFAADLAVWHWGILHTRLANSTLFANATSLLFALYGIVVLGHRLGRYQRMAMGLAVVGIALLLGRSYELSPTNMLGDLACLLAGVFYLGYLIAVDKTRGNVAAMPLLTLSSLAGVVPLLVLALMLGENLLPGNWTAVILLAIGSQVLGQGLIVFAIGHLSPVVVGLTLLVQPLIAATIGWVRYGEQLDGIDIIGALAIAAALVLVRREDKAANA